MAVAYIRNILPYGDESYYKKPTREKSHRTNTTAKGNYEKYIMLADQSIIKGDRINAEIFYQHAEHYLRLLKGAEPSNNDDAWSDVV